MSQMIVRPPQIWRNPLGANAEEYKIYVGKPFQDPTQVISQLSVTDGKSGDILEQPIIVTDGLPRNAGGQQVLMTVNTQNYSILYEAPNGLRVYSESSMFGDGLESGGGGGGAIPDEIFNNLEQAKAADLTGFAYIFIKGATAGWEGTETGPTINSLYYYSGGTGSPSTGTDQTFYDGAGNEWGLAKSVAEQINEADTATNTQAIADNAAQIASNAGDITDNATAAATAQAAANAAQQTADSALAGSSLIMLSENQNVSVPAGDYAMEVHSTIFVNSSSQQNVRVRLIGNMQFVSGATHFDLPISEVSETVRGVRYQAGNTSSVDLMNIDAAWGVQAFTFVNSYGVVTISGTQNIRMLNSTSSGGGQIVMSWGRLTKIS